MLLPVWWIEMTHKIIRTRKHSSRVSQSGMIRPAPATRFRLRNSDNCSGPAQSAVHHGDNLPACVHNISLKIYVFWRRNAARKGSSSGRKVAVSGGTCRSSLLAGATDTDQLQRNSGICAAPRYLFRHRPLCVRVGCCDAKMWRFLSFLGHYCARNGDKIITAGWKTRSSAIAEGPRDASCQLKSCQLPRNRAETTCTTSPEPSISCR